MPSRKRGVRQAGVERVFAQRLKGARLARGMSQRDLADRAHVTFSYISRLEAGGTAPGIDLLERLAQALQIDVIDLLPPHSSVLTADEHRDRIRNLFDAVLQRSGPETLSMIEVFLSRIGESPALSR